MLNIDKKIDSSNQEIKEFVVKYINPEAVALIITPSGKHYITYIEDDIRQTEELK